MRDFHRPGRSPVFAENGMCATSHPLATSIAIDTLKAGGNAVDAAIAGAVLLSLCEPQMCGIGGDCFVLFTAPGEDTVHALNGSGRAPAGIDATALRAAGHAAIPELSAHAVTIPGVVDAFCALNADWGHLPLDRVLAPAIHYAEAGVPVAPRVAFDWALSEDRLSGAARDHFLLAGKPPRAGDVFRAPGQARALRLIADRGRAGFYEDEIANDIVATLNAQGGSHTLDDFAQNAPAWTDPISGPFDGAELIEHPPNGAGAIALLIGRMLECYDIAKMDPFGANRAHIEAEITKLAIDARNRFIADPDHVTRLDHLLSQDTADRLAGLIDPKRALPHPAPLAETVHKETVFITVVDKDRMKVSLIFSIYGDFGSGIASEKFGIALHNRGAGFTLAEGHPNEAGPGRRPMHTILPAMLREDDRIAMTLGVMGTSYQPVGQMRVLSNMRYFGMDAQSAIDGPRTFADGDILKVERGFDDGVHADLSDRGHNVVVPDMPIGGAQAIQIDRTRGVLQGASDPRKDGCALGY